MTLEDDVREIKNDVDSIRSKMGDGILMLIIAVACVGSCLYLSNIASYQKKQTEYQRQQVEIQQKQLEIMTKIYSGD